MNLLDPPWLWCADCWALARTAGTGRYRLACVVLDGRSLCDEHAAPMIKVLAERSPGEHGDDEGQG